MSLFRRLSRRLSRNEEGFTLIELLIVIAILGILAGIAVPRITGTRDEAAKAALESSASSIRNSMEMFYAAEGNYPAVVAGAVNSGNPDFQSGTSDIDVDISGADGLSITTITLSPSTTTPDAYEFVISDGDWQVTLSSTSGVGTVEVASP